MNGHRNRNLSEPSGPAFAMSTISRYYNKLESRIGYRLILGGTRHFGYYTSGTWWPFPIGKALRALEEYLYLTIGLKDDALLLDGGAGVCDIPIYMAKKGLNVKAIDLLDMHVKWGKRNVIARKADDRVAVLEMSYQNLEFENAIFDGAYTMETLVNATDPDQAIQEFYRVLRPGGVIVHMEYEHDESEDPAVMCKLDRVCKGSSIPAFQQFTYGTIQQKLEKAGFVDVEVRNLSENVLPMLRLFFLLAVISYAIIRLPGLEARFVNVMAAVDMYRIGDHIRFISVKARKPKNSPALFVKQQTYTNAGQTDDGLRRR